MVRTHRVVIRRRRLVPPRSCRHPAHHLREHVWHVVDGVVVVPPSGAHVTRARKRVVI
eukprot:COSAG02_NODE_11335_length_1744_cov_3.935431_2_plen_57_part_01